MSSPKLVKTVNWMVVIALAVQPPLAAVASMSAQAAAVEDAPSGTAPLQSPLPYASLPASDVSCELYPIALSAESLAGAAVGDEILDIYNGDQPGNFGWLTWTGNPSVPALVESLTPPGDSSTYVNPNDPDDHEISVGDWVEGKPGVSNSKDVRDALDELKSYDIAVPVWGAVDGQGSNSLYQVTAYARVRILDYHLPGENRISVLFLGYTCEGAVIDLDKAVDDLSLPPTLDMTFSVDQVDAIPGDELIYSTTVANSGTTLILSGTFNAVNMSDTLATVAYYDDFIEYLAVGSTDWIPLAGTASGLPGYSPVSPAPKTSGMTLSASGISADGVTYPSDGDGIVGTEIESGSTAAWEYQVTVVLSPEFSNLLLDPAQTQDIRNNIHFEVTPRNEEAGQPFRWQTAFLSDLQSQSGHLSDATIDLILPNDEALVLDSSTTPALASLAPGDSVSVESAYTIPAVEARGSEETQEDYLARLSTADGAVLTATAEAAANSDDGPVTSPQETAQTTQHLPIMTLEKSGPETVEPGATVTYELSLTNVGSAAARELALEDWLPDDELGLIDDAPEELEPGATAIAHASHDLPITQLPGDLSDTALVRWEDANDNGYGPVSDEFTTEVLLPLPGGVVCFDWRSGRSNGWIDSSPDRVVWDENGMYAVGDPATSSAYVELPDGPWSLLFIWNEVGAFTVAQGDEAPAPGVLFENTVAPDGSGAYTITAPFVQLQWPVDGPFDPATTTVFYTFCYGPVPEDVNQPPQVDAGPDLELWMGLDELTVTLDGTATDDGLPFGTLNLDWRRTFGPISLVIDDASVEDPTVTLSEPGTYLLHLVADDGELSAGDTMQIHVRQLADLVVQSVDANQIVTDGQTMEVSGTAAAEIANLGDGSAEGAFIITFFEDLNDNGTYEPGEDNPLGETIQASLDAGESISVAAAVSGNVLFLGNRVYAFVDSQDAIRESDETNNYGDSGGVCVPPAPGDFSPVLEWEWTGSDIFPAQDQSIMAPAVIDLNGDQIPDIIFSTYTGANYTTDAHLRAISGDGSGELFTVTDPAYDLRARSGIAVGDIDLDGYPEIIAGDESGSRLIAFEHDGSFKWRSPKITSRSKNNVHNGGPAIADLDNDGIPEVIVGATVFNSDGTLRWTGAYGIGYGSLGPLSIVADLDMDGSPEVVAGNTAYRADGSLYWYNSEVVDGFNATGNFDSDPFPEVVVVGDNSVYLLEHDGTYKWPGPVDIPGAGYGGAPTVADMDGDGIPEIGVAARSRYVVYKADGSILWSIPVHDYSSAATGSSVFDFEGDGQAEVIYGDENYLRVYRGSDGAVLWETPSLSRTTYELPVIADVDADGNAEIVKVTNNGGGSGTTGVHVYGDADDNWVATRQIWNQHTYHITNVNEDGSIPTYEANNWEIYNNYRQNVYTLGCATGRPDLTASYLRRDDSDEGITLTARIGNGGGIFVPAGVYVSFYDGDPADGGALLGTTTTTERLDPGDFQDVSLVVPFSTRAEPVWVAADDTGGLNGLHTELDEVNNLYRSQLNLEPVAYRTYTLDADFDEGAYQHVDHDEESDELRLQAHPDRFDFLWVAVSTKGTIVKIDVNTGEVVSEFRTSPSGQPKNPSRTTVDNNGSVWVANRNGNSVTHIGLLENSECDDRNGDGVIQTSTGLNDLLLWTNSGGADTNGGVSTAEDECIIHYVRVSSSGTRHVSVDQDNNVWVSGTVQRIFDLVDGETGQILRTEGPVGYGGYGGLIDSTGVIWSALYPTGLLRWDTALPLTGPNGDNWIGYPYGSYGLCIDNQGNVWNTSYHEGLIRKYAPDGTLLDAFTFGAPNAKGCVVDYNGHVWVAHAETANTVGHLLPDGTYVGKVTVGNGPTGVAVDANGKIWATNRYGRTVSRIDPSLGPTGSGGVPVGAVDFTSVNLGGELYNYSDMTGSTLSKLPEEGHWEVVFDSEIDNAEWGVLGWTANTCNDSLIEVFAASSNNGSTFSALESVENHEPLTVPDGRYLRITANFARATTGETPVLYDLTVGSAGYILPNLPPAPEVTCITSSPDLSLSNAQQLVVGNDLTLSARVNNLGGIAAPAGVEVTFYTGDPSLPGTSVLGTAMTVGGIAPGAYEQVSLTLQLGTAARPVWIGVDEADEVVELNERNNRLATTIYLSPDLVVSGLDLSDMAFDVDTLAAPGEIRVIVDNIGTAEAFGGFHTLLFEDRDGNGAYDETVDLLLGDILESILPPGESLALTADLPEDTTLSFRDSILVAIVDSTDLQIELDETDNIYTTAAETLPDLTASYMRKTVEADHTDLTVRIGNGSLVSLPAGIEVAVYDGDPATGGTRIDTVLTTLPLGPGDYEDLTVSIPLGVQALPAWVWVDPADAYTEPDEDNNLYQSRAWVSPVPNQAPEVDAGPDRVLPLPGGWVLLQATATDDGWPQGELSFDWRMVSGPGQVTFSDEGILTPQVTVDEPGEYLLEIVADDMEYRTSDTMTLHATNAPPCNPSTIQGFIASPLNQTAVNGQVSVILSEGITLEHIRVDAWPANDPNAYRTLAAEASGSGGSTVATLDTTTLSNGSYVICAVGFSPASEQWESSAVMVTAEGEYKPGRVRFTITDLTVPIVGLPITIGRTYDSLERSQVGDFGHGWSLAIGNPSLEIDPANNVTLTMPDGKRSTFYFTPYVPSYIFGFLSVPNYTSEAGVYGKLESNGCGLLTLSGGQWFCFPGNLYSLSVTEFTYTDPYGREFVMSTDGTLKSITDLNGNTLTFSPDGITSSTGLNVPFVRDSQGRIVRITGPENRAYTYAYDANGDLETVILPDVTQSGGGTQSIQVGYEYYPGHFFKSATDPRGYQPVLSTYTADGRLESITDAAGARTSYAYDLPNHTTVVSYEGDPNDPADDLGQSTFVYDDGGYLRSVTNPLNETTRYEYDEDHNLRFVRDPLDNETEYTYDDDGNRTAIIDPLDHTLILAQYNLYGGPTSLASAAGNTYTIDYDPLTYMPLSASDSLGTLGGYTWDDHGNPLTFTDEHAGTTTYTYDDYGNVETETDPLTHTTDYTYDGYGRMESRSDPLDHATTYQYDELGRLVRVTNAEEGTTRYEYDAFGNRTAVVDPMGRRTETVYDSANRVIDVIRGAHDPGAATTTHYEYDVYGRVTDVTTAYGTALAQTTHTVYDAVGRRTRVTYASGTSAASTTAYAYDDAGRVTDVTSAYGTAAASTTHYAYDAAGRQTDMTSAYGTVDASTTHYQYDDAGQLTQMTAGYGTSHAVTTRYAYDVRGRQTLATYPDDSTVAYTYESLPGGDGSLQSIRDGAGITTEYVYDLAGRLDRRVVIGLGSPGPRQVTHYEYDAAGRQTSVVDPLGTRSSYTYDDVGRMLTSTQWLDPSTGYTTTYAYNDAGQVETTTDANLRVTSYHYDSLGRLESVGYPGGVSTSQTYDAAGRMETATDENGTLTRYGYDPAGRLDSVTLADGSADAATTSYAYNAAGQLVSITDALDRITGFEYDHAGRQSAKIWPDESEEYFGYDVLGNQTSHRLADGNTNTFNYDSMGRLLEINYFDESSAAFTYSDGGYRETASVKSDPLAEPQTTVYSYDAFMRPERVTAPDERAVSYAYDDANRRTGMTTWLDAVTQAGSVDYDYDSLGRLESVEDEHGATTFGYDPVGVLTEWALPNGVVTTYDYNERYQLTGITHSNSVVTLQSFDYTLDDAGNRLSATEVDGSRIDWTYDAAYRLIGEQRYDPLGTLLSGTSFTYDDAGNRLTQTVDGQTTNYAYNELDQLTGVSGPDGDVTYTYDGRGNLAQTVAGSEITTSSFDAADRLAGAALPDGTQVEYGYDADGRRVSQAVDGETIDYLWDHYSRYGDVLLETDAGGAPLVSYTLANGQLISLVRDGVPSYYLGDGQGSVRALVDSAGAISDTYAYTAFGELYAQSGATENSYLYTGQQFDEVTGLYSLRARYYAPGLGRFLSQDTAGVSYGNPVELNRYVYVADDPVNRIDPSGMLFAEYSLNTVKSVAPTFVIGGAVGGAFISGIVCILAACGLCGDTVEGQMAPGGIGSCAAAALKGARFGAFAGGTIAVAAGIGPAAAGYVTAFWGGVGLGTSVYNMITNRKPDLCNLFMMAVSLYVGTVGARRAFRYVQSVKFAEGAHEVGQHRDMKLPVGDDLDSHHVVQDEWALRQNIDGYKSRDATAIRLTKPEHWAANAVQEAFRAEYGYNTTFAQEIQLAKDALNAAELSLSEISAAIEAAIQYFSNLGVH